MTEPDERDPVTGRLLAPARPATYWGRPEDAEKETARAFRALRRLHLIIATVGLLALLVYMFVRFAS